MASVSRMSFLSVMLFTCLVPTRASLPVLVGSTNHAAIPGMITHSINKAVNELSNMKQLERQFVLSGNTMMAHGQRMGSPHGRMFSHIFHTADPSATTHLSDKGYITTKATEELVRLTNTPLRLLQSDPYVIREWRRQISPHCNIALPHCNPAYRYRTAEGTCNNLNRPTWGSAMTPFTRYLPATYLDGINSPRQVSVSGRPLPSPRVVSNVLHSTGRSDLDEGGRSVLFMSWGTLLVFDLLRTSVSKGFNNSDISCCTSGEANVRQMGSCFPIMIPRGDRRFSSQCMNFVRSAATPSQSCNLGVREQMNEQSSFMDASMIYGSNQETQNRLRSGRGGYMKTSFNGLLPPASDDTCTLSGPGEYCFDAGDARNSLVPSLAAVFVVLVREHNRIARQLHQYNPHWSDEKLFQETRKILIAVVQHINYNEYLPHVLSNKHMLQYGLYPTSKGHRTVHNPNVNPTVANVFGAAAFRYGHSNIPDVQGMKDHRTHQSVETHIEFTYLRPAMLFANNGRGADKINLWQLHSRQARQDRFLQNGVRNELLLDAMGGALDLAAVNLQRGRDHGIASYNAWRKWCGLRPASHFGTGPGGLIDLDPVAAILLSKVYSHPDDIDLFTGGLSEVKIRGTLTGPTFSCIIAKQFQFLKQGDRFFYEHDNPIVGFTTAQLNEIKNVRLSQVMCANAGIRKIQQHAFLVPSLNNRMVGCEFLPRIDLRHWIERPFRKGQILKNLVIVPYSPVRVLTFSS